MEDDIKNQADDRFATLKEINQKQMALLEASFERKNVEVRENLIKSYDDQFSRLLKEQPNLMKERPNKHEIKLHAEIKELKEKLRKAKEQAPEKEDHKEQYKENKSGCFADPSLVRVQQKDGSVVEKLLSELNVDDKVESYDFQTNKMGFSDVYIFPINCFIGILPYTQGYFTYMMAESLPQTSQLSMR